MIRTYTISELELMSGFTRRTISDYIAKGILAGPSHRGRGARYAQSDVDVLQLVPRIRTLMKKEFPDLKSISSFLRHLSNHDLSRMASRTNEKALVQEIRRLRVRLQLAALLPMVAPEKIDECLKELSPAQLSAIDNGRYPIGSMLNVADLVKKHQPPMNDDDTAREAVLSARNIGNDADLSRSFLNADKTPPAASLDFGSLEESIRRIERQFLSMDRNRGAEGARWNRESTEGVRHEDISEGSVERRISDIANRVERLERLLED
jgi:DNA-binding transcriptional MerR regulator